jgi:hypothetical protein
MKCSLHPDVETNLRCGKCEKLICPRCMVQTPVGARCKECARVYKIPTYTVSKSYYLRAAFAAVGIALACGILWSFLYSLIPYFFFFNIFLGAVVGYACAEIIGLATNRKRGIGLTIVASGAVVLSYLVGLIVPWGFIFSYYDILGIAAGIFVAATRIR